MDGWSKVLRPTLHKIGHFGDVLPSQFLGMVLKKQHTDTHIHTHTQPFNGLWSGTTQVGLYQKKHSPTHTHPHHRNPLSPSSIFNDQWHPLCSFYVLDSPLVKPLSRSSLVFLLVLDPQLHTPYISSPNRYLLFATHAHTTANCLAKA